VAGFGCYEDFMRALSQRAEIAESVLRFGRQGHAKALEDVVNAMASEPVPSIAQQSNVNGQHCGANVASAAAA
jgi:hypothetical protein